MKVTPIFIYCIWNIFKNVLIFDNSATMGRQISARRFATAVVLKLTREPSREGSFPYGIPL